MKERPIIFSGSMMRAILSKQKVQTRRIIKPQPVLGKPWKDWIVDPEEMDLPMAYCPYGIARDFLWVRETWATSIKWDGLPPRIIPTHSPVWYKATSQGKGDIIGKWRPSIYMPRWASHIMLEITDVRVERLQDISVKNCIAEGFDPVQQTADGITLIPAWQVADDTAHLMFRQKWDELNAKRGCGWDKNPWVWVIDFRMLEEKSGTY